MTLSLPVRNLVEAVTAEPTDLATLAEKLQYPAHRVLQFIGQARSAGVEVCCVARPGLTSVFVVHGGDTNAKVSLTELPSMEEHSQR